MVGSEAPKSSPNPNNVHHIGGIPVEFPYKPYGSQLAFMGRVISTLDRAKRQGHCHALLESPTGTGKSLSLLCSTLAWQHNYRTKNLYTNLSQSKPAPEAISDPLGHGGGFIPEMEPSGNLEPSSLEQTPGKLTKSQKKKAVPTIYYASRTHSQISQVIREYRKTAYRVPMAVLASRKNYCTNKSLCGKDSIDEECKMLLKDKEVGCFEFKNAHKVKGHPSFQKGGCSEAHDIEDLVKVGKAVKGCSYFAAHSFAEEAQLIFCPYNYIINPTIRRSMDVDIKGSIVILDEAHNIEDMARDAGSTEIEEDILFTLQMELQSLCLADSEIYQPLYDVIQGIIGWIGQRKDTLAKHDFQHYFSCWTGDKALRELQEIGISQQFFPILKECVTKAIKAASDAEAGLPHLSGMSLMMLEGLFSSLGYFFSGDGRHTVDYQLVLQRYVKKESGRASTGWTHSLGLWCLNPAVVFREIADLSMSVILTSGTLSPMNTFSSELGVQFETCMEAPHVIDMESQVWAAAISTGPGNYPLNASYKMADNYGFQDALGASLEEICKIVPGGVLVFFPSYKLMDKLCARWHETGQWTRLNAQKSLFVEPKGSQDEFEHVLKGYYDTINHGRTASAWKIRKGKKRYVNHSDMEGTPEPSSKGGAAFLAVCRGKVSEGIDFADANARAVVIVGIPFPNINDIQVAQKKKFNDTYRSSKNLLSGSEWYCNQAFRALNQAAGRCIRHRFDYGAIILLDERYREERNMAHISKWLRRSIKHNNSFDMSLEGLHSFFHDVKERNGVVSENSVINEKNSPLMPKVSSKVCGRKKNQKGDKLDNPNGGRVLPESVSTAGKAGRFSDSMNSVGKHYAFPPKQKSKDNVGGLSFVQEDKKDVKNNREYIDLDCSPQRDTRWSEITSLASCNGSPELFVVKETPGLYSNTSMASSAVASNEENSNTKVVQASSEFSDQLSLHSAAAENSNAVLSMVTPKKLTDADFCNLKPEIESSLNLSVNSHMPKKRKPINLSLINSYQMDSLESLDAKCPLNIDHMIKKEDFSDANCRNKLSFGADCIESECHQLHVPQMKLVNSSSIVSSCSAAVSDKSLNICCSLCRNSLGLPKNQFLVSCSLTSSSKVYMASFLKSELEDWFMSESASVPIVISDISLVDQRLYTHFTANGAENHGIWSEKDGCVFKTIFCPFCAVSNRFLGQQVMATDANNTHLLNKILFYLDRVFIKDVEASKVKALTPVDDFVNGGAAQYSISSGSDDELVSGSMGKNKVSCPSKRERSGGWRTTRSKLRLPKRALLRDTDEISM